MTMPDKTVTPLLAASGQTERKSRFPLALRDTLLPKRISGELRGKTGEPYVAVVTP